MVALQFLGAGDAFGSGGRFQACIAVNTAAGSILLDCGASSLIAMRRFGFEPGTIEAVIVSHLHGDHFGGLPFLVLDQQFGRRERPLVIAGPPGIELRVREAMEVLFPGSTAVQRKFDVQFIELQERIASQVGAVRATAYAARHPSGAPAYALQVETDGTRIAYSGDTEWTDALLEVASGVDVFICEAYTYDRAARP